MSDTNDVFVLINRLLCQHARTKIINRQEYANYHFQITSKCFKCGKILNYSEYKKNGVAKTIPKNI